MQHKAGMFWGCKYTWRRSAYNTMWCLIGCSIGDFGTIAFFQYSDISISTLAVMILAMINGLLTSVLLETVILFRQGLQLRIAIKTAMGMSFISMLAMETAMNLTDVVLTGGAILTWWVIPIAMLMGFITPWPYNYWRLKKFGVACH